MKYKVLKEFISQDGGHYFKGETYPEIKQEMFVKALISEGFIEPDEPEVDFERWEKEGKRSKLAKVIIAPEDYKEGDKEYFTWQEAMDKAKELNNGWRLPTNKEWNLIAWEFGEKDDLLDSITLRENLNLELKGYQDANGRLRHSGLNGYGWSSRGYSSTAYAYFLAFDASDVNPSYNYYRWLGFPLRLVKDIK